MYSRILHQTQAPAARPRISTTQAPPDAVRFRITMPYWSDLNRDFLMHLDEFNENSHPAKRPLKFGVFGAFKQLHDRHIEQTFKIRFYELCPETETELDCFASVEWRVQEDPRTGEVKFWNGMISFPFVGLDSSRDSVDVFMRKAGYKARRPSLTSLPDPTLTRQLLVDDKGTHHFLENVVQTHTNGTHPHYLSARHVHPAPVDYYSVVADLQKKKYKNRDYDGKIEMYNIPRQKGMKCRDSPILWPLMVWLVLSVLERDREAFTAYPKAEVAPSEYPRPNNPLGSRY